MSYNFKTNINEKEFDKFVKSYNSTSFMQISSWAKIKTNWDYDLVGMYENDKLVCSAVLLIKKLFLNKKLIYIPRGFVIDYNNKMLLKEFIVNLKTYAKNKNAIDIKIDPFICFSCKNIQTIKKNKDIDVRDTFVKNTDYISDLLIQNGFIHAGYEKRVNSYIQPRYTMAVSLKKTDNTYYDLEELRKTFPKNTRNYIGKYQEQRGVYFKHSKNIDDVDKLILMLNQTEKRQHIALRNSEYFKKMMSEFKEEAVLFFAYVDINKYIDFLEKDTKENEIKKEFNDKQIKEAKQIKEKYGNNPLAGATIVMMPTCKTGNKVASFLYAGTNTEILPSLKITNGLMFYRLSYCLDNKCDYCDLGGIDGTLGDHLSNFKSKFNPEVLELVGEYDLIINKLLFKIFNLLLKIYKRRK